MLASITVQLEKVWTFHDCRVLWKRSFSQASVFCVLFRLNIYFIFTCVKWKLAKLQRTWTEYFCPNVLCNETSEGLKLLHFPNVQFFWVNILWTNSCLNKLRKSETTIFVPHDCVNRDINKRLLWYFNRWRKPYWCIY